MGRGVSERPPAAPSRRRFSYTAADGSRHSVIAVDREQAAEKIAARLRVRSSGIVSETKARSSGAVIRVIDNRTGWFEALGSEHPREMRWATECTAHGNYCLHSTRKLAESFASVPEEWCENCREIAHPEDVEDENPRPERHAPARGPLRRIVSNENGVETLACGHQIPRKLKIDFWGTVAPDTAYRRYCEARSRRCPHCTSA